MPNPVTGMLGSQSGSIGKLNNGKTWMAGFNALCGVFGKWNIHTFEERELLVPHIKFSFLKTLDK